MAKKNKKRGKHIMLAVIDPLYSANDPRHKLHDDQVRELLEDLRNAEFRHSGFVILDPHLQKEPVAAQVEEAIRENTALDFGQTTPETVKVVLSFGPDGIKWSHE